MPLHHCQGSRDTFRAPGQPSSPHTWTLFQPVRPITPPQPPLLTAPLLPHSLPHLSAPPRPPPAPREAAPPSLPPSWPHKSRLGATVTGAHSHESRGTLRAARRTAGGRRSSVHISSTAIQRLQAALLGHWASGHVCRAHRAHLLPATSCLQIPGMQRSGLNKLMEISVLASNHTFDLSYLTDPV